MRNIITFILSSVLTFILIYICSKYLSSWFVNFIFGKTTAANPATMASIVTDLTLTILLTSCVGFLCYRISSAFPFTAICIGASAYLAYASFTLLNIPSNTLATHYPFWYGPALLAKIVLPVILGAELSKWKMQSNK